MAFAKERKQKRLAGPEKMAVSLGGNGFPAPGRASVQPLCPPNTRVLSAASG